MSDSTPRAADGEWLNEVEDLIRSGRWGEADSKLKDARWKAPGSGEVPLQEATLAIRRWSLLAETEGTPYDDPRLLNVANKARRLLKEASLSDPTVRVRCLLTSAILESSYDQEASLEICRQALAIERTALTLGQYANLLGEARRFAESDAAFAEALEVDEDSVVNLLNFGRQMMRREPPDALSGTFLFARALGLDPASAEAHYRLGDALGLLPGRLREGQEHLEQSLRLDPSPALRDKINATLAETLEAIASQANCDEDP